MDNPTVEEVLQLSSEERRHLAMATFGQVFPQMQELLERLTTQNTVSISEQDLMLCIHAIYLASIEYTRYCTEQADTEGAIH